MSRSAFAEPGVSGGAKPRARAHAFLDLPPSLGRVAALLVEGLSDKAIAERTGLTHATVRTYVRRLFGRVGVCSRVELTLRVLDRARSS